MAGSCPTLDKEVLVTAPEERRSQPCQNAATQVVPQAGRKLAIFTKRLRGQSWLLLTNNSTGKKGP